MDCAGNFSILLSQIQQNLQCSICLEMLTSPVATECHHKFCSFCISKFLNTKRSVPCPLCKMSVTKRSLQAMTELSVVIQGVKRLIAAFEEDTGEVYSPSKNAVKTLQAQEASTSTSLRSSSNKKTVGKPSSGAKSRLRSGSSSQGKTESPGAATTSTFPTNLQEKRRSATSSASKKSRSTDNTCKEEQAFLNIEAVLKDESDPSMTTAETNRDELCHDPNTDSDSKPTSRRALLKYLEEGEISHPDARSNSDNKHGNVKASSLQTDTSRKMFGEDLVSRQDPISDSSTGNIVAGGLEENRNRNRLKDQNVSEVSERGEMNRFEQDGDRIRLTRNRKGAAEKGIDELIPRSENLNVHERHNRGSAKNMTCDSKDKSAGREELEKSDGARVWTRTRSRSTRRNNRKIEQGEMDRMKEEEDEKDMTDSQRQQRNALNRNNPDLILSNDLNADNGDGDGNGVNGRGRRKTRQGNKHLLSKSPGKTEHLVTCVDGNDVLSPLSVSSISSTQQLQKPIQPVSRTYSRKMKTAFKENDDNVKWTLTKSGQDDLEPGHHSDDDKGEGERDTDMSLHNERLIKMAPLPTEKMNEAGRNKKDTNKTKHDRCEKTMCKNKIREFVRNELLDSNYQESSTVVDSCEFSHGNISTKKWANENQNEKPLQTESQEVCEIGSRSKRLAAPQISHRRKTIFKSKNTPAQIDLKQMSHPLTSSSDPYDFQGGGTPNEKQCDRRKCTRRNGKGKKINAKTPLDIPGLKPVALTSSLFGKSEFSKEYEMTVCSRDENPSSSVVKHVRFVKLDPDIETVEDIGKQLVEETQKKTRGVKENGVVTVDDDSIGIERSVNEENRAARIGKNDVTMCVEEHDNDGNLGKTEKHGNVESMALEMDKGDKGLVSLPLSTPLPMRCRRQRVRRRGSRIVEVDEKEREVELERMRSKINDAEDYEFMFSTQEAQQRMVTQQAEEKRRRSREIETAFGFDSPEEIEGRKGKDSVRVTDVGDRGGLKSKGGNVCTKDVGSCHEDVVGCHGDNAAEIESDDDIGIFQDVVHDKCKEINDSDVIQDIPSGKNGNLQCQSQVSKADVGANSNVKHGVCDSINISTSKSQISSALSPTVNDKQTVHNDYIVYSKRNASFLKRFARPDLSVMTLFKPGIQLESGDAVENSNSKLSGDDEAAAVGATKSTVPVESPKVVFETPLSPSTRKESECFIGSVVNQSKLSSMGDCNPRPLIGDMEIGDGEKIGGNGISLTEVENEVKVTESKARLTLRGLQNNDEASNQVDGLGDMEKEWDDDGGQGSGVTSIVIAKDTCIDEISDDDDDDKDGKLVDKNLPLVIPDTELADTVLDNDNNNIEDGSNGGIEAGSTLEDNDNNNIEDVNNGGIEDGSNLSRERVEGKFKPDLVTIVTQATQSPALYTVDKLKQITQKSQNQHSNCITECVNDDNDNEETCDLNVDNDNSGTTIISASRSQGSLVGVSQGQVCSGKKSPIMSGLADDDACTGGDDTPDKTHIESQDLPINSTYTIKVNGLDRNCEESQLEQDEQGEKKDFSGSKISKDKSDIRRQLEHPNVDSDGNGQSKSLVLAQCQHGCMDTQGCESGDKVIHKFTSTSPDVVVVPSLDSQSSSPIISQSILSTKSPATRSNNRDMAKAFKSNYVNMTSEKRQLPRIKDSSAGQSKTGNISQYDLVTSENKEIPAEEMAVDQTCPNTSSKSDCEDVLTSHSSTLKSKESGAENEKLIMSAPNTPLNGTSCSNTNGINQDCGSSSNGLIESVGRKRRSAACDLEDDQPGRKKRSRNNRVQGSAPAKLLCVDFFSDSDEERDSVLIVRRSKRKCLSLDSVPLEPVVFGSDIVNVSMNNRKDKTSAISPSKEAIVIQGSLDDPNSQIVTEISHCTDTSKVQSSTTLSQLKHVEETAESTVPPPDSDDVPDQVEIRSDRSEKSAIVIEPTVDTSSKGDSKTPIRKTRRGFAKKDNAFHKKPLVTLPNSVMSQKVREAILKEFTPQTDLDGRNKNIELEIQKKKYSDMSPDNGEAGPSRKELSLLEESMSLEIQEKIEDNTIENAEDKPYKNNQDRKEEEESKRQEMSEGLGSLKESKSTTSHSSGNGTNHDTDIDNNSSDQVPPLSETLEPVTDVGVLEVAENGSVKDVDGLDESELETVKDVDGLDEAELESVKDVDDLEGAECGTVKDVNGLDEAGLESVKDVDDLDEAEIESVEAISIPSQSEILHSSGVQSDEDKKKLEEELFGQELQQQELQTSDSDSDLEDIQLNIKLTLSSASQSAASSQGSDGGGGCSQLNQIVQTLDVTTDDVFHHLNDSLNDDSDINNSGSVTNESEEFIIPSKNRKRRIITSDSEEDEVGDETENDVGNNSEINNTSSSAFSSQSDLMSTQQRDALEREVAELQKKIALCESALHGGGSREAKSSSSSNPNTQPKTMNEDRNHDYHNNDRNHDDDKVIAVESIDKTSNDEDNICGQVNDKDNDPEVISDDEDLFILPPSPSPPEKPPSKPTAVSSRPVLSRSSGVTRNVSKEFKQFQSPGGSLHKRRPLLEFSSNSGTLESSHSQTIEMDANYNSNEKHGDHVTNANVQDVCDGHDNDKGLQEDERTSLVTQKRNMAVIVVSGLSGQEMQLVQKLTSTVPNVRLSAKVLPDVTHVIMKTLPGRDMVCDRTLKYFQGIARRLWIVSIQWVARSLQAGDLVPEREFEILGDTSVGDTTQGPKRARLAKEKLFDNYGFSCVGNSPELPKDIMEELVALCGGSVLQDLIALPASACENKIIIRCTDAEMTPMEKAMLNGVFDSTGVVSVKRDWVLDCVSSYQIVPLDDYRLVHTKI